MIKTQNVEKVLVEMLTENTGTHMLDSGGAYGRLWQRNQGKKLKDFLKEPSVYWKDGSYTISLFHLLRRDLEIDALAEMFNSKFVPAKDYDGGELEEVYGVSKIGVEWLREQGFKFGRTFNSYNGESSLSQVIQGTWLKFGDRNYLILQIHGGCDVRGGYTDARLFYVPGYEDGALSEDVYGTVTKPNGEQISVDNLYNGVSLSGENGADVEITKDDKVQLWLMER